MNKVEPSPETADKVSAFSRDLLAVEAATLRGWGTELRHKGGRIGATALLAMSGALAINNDQGVDTEVGPVNATVHLTIDKDSAAVAESLPAGVRFKGKTGIPMVGAGITLNRTASTQNDDLTSTGDILKNLGILDDPKAVANKVISDYVHQALDWGTAGLIYGGLAGAMLDYGGFGNTERRKRRRATACLSILALTLSGYIGHQPTNHYAGNQWNTFELQIGQDTAIKFGYNGVIGNWAADQYAKNVETYNTIQKNLITTLKPIAAEDNLLHPNQKKINVFSDWHCNIGMARNIGTIDKTMGVNATINAGDDALGGLPQESICADILTYNIKSTAGENYLAPGNHDFDFMIDEFKQDGVQVLNGKVMMIDGVRTLGFEDPTTSPAGVDTIHSRNFPGMNEDQVNALVDRFKQDVAEKTCKANPAILVIHEPQETPGDAMNCATLTINGHTHVVKLPQRASPDAPDVNREINPGSSDVNHTVINDGSVGGIASDKQGVVSDLNKEATSYIAYVADGQPVGVRLITIKTDGSVEISDYMPIPHPVIDKQAASVNERLPSLRHLPSYAASDLYGRQPSTG